MQPTRQPDTLQHRPLLNLGSSNYTYLTYLTDLDPTFGMPSTNGSAGKHIRVSSLSVSVSVAASVFFVVRLVSMTRRVQTSKGSQVAAHPKTPHCQFAVSRHRTQSRCQPAAKNLAQEGL